MQWKKLLVRPESTCFSRGPRLPRGEDCYVISTGQVMWELGKGVTSGKSNIVRGLPPLQAFLPSLLTGWCHGDLKSSTAWKRTVLPSAYCGMRKKSSSVVFSALIVVFVVPAKSVLFWVIQRSSSRVVTAGIRNRIIQKEYSWRAVQDKLTGWT